MSYIEREYLLEALSQFNDRENGNEHFINGIETAMEIISNAPDTEVREVVICKNCKWWKRHNNTVKGRCALFGIYPVEAWFCGNGNKKNKR